MWFCCIVEESLKNQFHDLGFHVIDFWAIWLITNGYLPLVAVLHLNASIWYGIAFLMFNG